MGQTALLLILCFKQLRLEWLATWLEAVLNQRRNSYHHARISTFLHLYLRPNNTHTQTTNLKCVVTTTHIET
jgi:hypothetical protein